MNNKKKTLSEKMSDISSCWDNEERYLFSMPEREMLYGNGFVNNNPGVLDSITLDLNADWMLWELEMMED